MNKILKIIGHAKLEFYKLRGMNIEYHSSTFFHPRAIIKGKDGRIVLSPNCIISKQTRFIVNEGATLSLAENVTIQPNCYIEVGKDGKTHIGKDTFFNEYCRMIALENICIGENVAFGPDVYVFDNDHIMKKNSTINWNEFKSAPIKIEDNVWLGARCVILRGTTIKHNSIIAATTVVKGNVDENMICYTKIERKCKEVE